MPKMNKRQAKHLKQLIENYASAREELYWESDQGSTSDRLVAQAERDKTEKQLNNYLDRLTTDR